MTTTIKINDKTKEKLDRLRTQMTGEKMEQEEFLEFIITMVESSGLLFNSEPYKGLSEEEQKEFFGFTFKTRQSERTIDEEIYSA